MSSAMVGRDLGPYKVLAPLGAGGMGEVYRARDTKLGRDVAIKILPPHFTSDPERRARFTREARHLATLNHPHIGAIYGLEEHGDVTALVLELVEGPTLAERLERGRLTVPEALDLARQIAAALDAAHQQGIVHRDLKPGNIIVTGGSSSELRAKVLDFGLAKSMATGGLVDVTETRADATGEGRILGTPAYMSPEQARGEDVDKRTDIWAFGCVLFEMLTGRRTFAGKTTVDTIARILERDVDWSILPAETPANIRTLLERCLRRDRGRRLHDIADAIIEIDDVGHSSPASAPAGVQAPGWWERPRVAWMVAVVLGAVAIAMTFAQLRGARISNAPAAGQALEFPIAPPEPWAYPSEMPAPNFEISPNGQHLAVVAISKDVPMLWVRPIASPAWRVVPGTEGAYGPFWSPDSLSLGFFMNRQLKTVGLNGGAPVTICTRPDSGGESNGGTWSAKGDILFGTLGPIMRVKASGGEPIPVSKVEGGDTHLWPSFLPDNEHFLYLARRAEGRSEILVSSIAAAGAESLGPATSHAAYADNHLFFVRNGRLMVQPFDASARRVTGDPRAITEQTAVVIPQLRGQFTVATAGSTGVLIHTPIGRPMYDLTWKDRGGAGQGTEGEPGFYFNLNLSPDDERLAVSRFAETGTYWDVDIWIVDRTRAGTSSRLTFNPDMELDPAWSPDGKHIVFTERKSGHSLFRRPASGSGDDELVAKAENGSFVAPDWSPDGRFLLYSRWGKDRGLWVLPLSAEGKPRAFLETPFNENAGVFSPDGRFVAYESDESGRRNICVRSFPSGDNPLQISRDGGRAPRWRGDGRELFFIAPDATMMAVAIEPGPAFRAHVPQLLFQTGLTEAIEHMHPYVVLKNGQRFLMPVKRVPPAHAPVTVVWNWPALGRQSQ